jgi:superfamily II DNA or RNA helicase
MQMLQSEVVRVRGDRWRVVDRREYGECTLLTLAGAGADNGGVERRILTPFDSVEPIERATRLRRVSARFWRRACRALVAGETPPGCLRTARQARIELLPHQLEPALAIVRGLGTRVLLADDVGLGKTIEAGLIISELRARGAADRVLLLTPAGLRDQWAHELADRLALDAVVVNPAAVRRALYTLPIGINPWLTFPIAIASIDYIKRPDVLASAAACRWDVVVVDEAHDVAGDSDRHAAVQALAARAPYVALLTATPHSGDRKAFMSLCGIGAVSGDSLLVFRRARPDVRMRVRRRIHWLHVRSTAAEQRMHGLLAELARAVRDERGMTDDAIALALSVLQKRALSSARSLQLSAERRLAVLTSSGGGDASQLRLPLADPDGELTSADLAPDWPEGLSLHDADRERDFLQGLAGRAAAAARHESKISALVRLLRRLDEPAIVFTEYRDTLLHLRDLLPYPAAVLHGGLTRQERLDVIDAFTHGSRRLLLATDAAGEGLNLHHTCRSVINLELPWNPVRLEQRIGRVDRIGQSRTVHAFHLIARGTSEVRILARLFARVASAQADMTGCEQADLSAEAASEASRVARARSFHRDGDDDALAVVEARGPCKTRVRKWNTRAHLGSRMLTFWRVPVVDGCGRMAGSKVVPVMVSPELLHLDDERLREQIEQSTAAWRGDVVRLHHAFVSTRLNRERSLSTTGVGMPSPIFQPGLFDRRAERARRAIAAAERDSALDTAGRIAALERSAALDFGSALLLLALLP